MTTDSHKEQEQEQEEEKEQDKEQDARPRTDSFDQFWQAYPKRVGKANAEAAWKKHGCNAILPQILTSIRACKVSADWTKDGGQFIPHPATWLNRRGWEDELGRPVNGTKRGEWLPSTPKLLDIPLTEEEKIEAERFQAQMRERAAFRAESQ